ncbi:MAG: hypothetical protein CL471_04940 [Acidobacteria bacterium]|nr:hypothetical protein [Acidobacteriota bacterium]
MGVVYHALDIRLRRSVALKFLPRVATRDDTAKARFVHEAQAASALDHPNTYTIYDIGETDAGQMYLAMAFYEGGRLRRLAALGESGPQPRHHRDGPDAGRLHGRRRARRHGARRPRGDRGDRLGRRAHRRGPQGYRRRGHRAGAAAALRRGRVRAAHRMCQHGQPAARARRRAAARDRAEIRTRPSRKVAAAAAAAAETVSKPCSSSPRSRSRSSF